MTATISRQPTGVPVGGEFAHRARPAGSVALLDAPKPTAEQRRLVLRTLAENEPDDAAALAAALPNLDPVLRANRWRDVVTAIDNAYEFESNPDASYSAPPQKLILPIDDFGGWNSPDRAGEGEYHGYDFDAYGKALSEAWFQNADDAVKELIRLDGEAGTDWAK